MAEPELNAARDQVSRRLSRRQFLTRAVGLATGSAVAVLAGKAGWHHLKGTTVRPPRERRPGHFFTRHEYDTLAAVASIIVPSDDLGPGAADVGAVDIIESRILGDGTMRRRYRDGLLWLDQSAARVYGWGLLFLDLSEAQRVALLEEAEREAKRLRRPAANMLDRAWRYWDRLATTLFGLGRGVLFFDLVRDDVLEAVYSQPEVWKVLGYDGPPQPKGYWNGAQGTWNIIDDCPPVKRYDQPR